MSEVVSEVVSMRVSMGVGEVVGVVVVFPVSSRLMGFFSRRYVDDIPPYENELYAGLVMSTHAHAKITVDTSAALKWRG